MASKNILLGGAAVLGVALLVGIAWRSQRVLERGLPPRVECASQADAQAKALAYIAEHGGSIVSVLGTGSMAPYIPPAAAGSDPFKTVVALVVTDARATFADIAPGKLCLYRAEWSPTLSVLHGAAQKDGDGWIMSGLANAHSEAFERMTPQKFDGVAVRTFVWSQ